MAINALQVKELRQTTGLPMMECKKALVEADGDLEKATQILRKRGLKVADKKAHRETKEGLIGNYIHHDGKSGALVSMTTNRPAEEVDAFLKTLGMHITAIRPVALTRDEIPAETVERERSVHLGSDDVQKKPEDKREMIVKGKLERFFKDAALVDQPWVLDPKASVNKALEAALGKGSKIEGYKLFQLG